MPRSRHRKKKYGRSRAGRRYFDDDLGLLSPPEERMSDVILEFIEPYREAAHDEATFEKLVALGIIAWNVALLPEAEREHELDKFAVATFGTKRASVLGRIRGWLRGLLGQPPPAAGGAGPRDIRDFKETARELIARKHRAFPNNRRFILDYQVEGTGEESQLFVISTLEPFRA
jgi:hypothetical protein